MARPRAQDYEEKRAQLLAASAELFAAKGYDGASITEIAGACGVSKALIYHYYQNKEQLLVDIIRRHLADILGAVERASAAESAPERRLRAVVGALLDCYRDADALHKIQVNELSRLPADLAEELKAMERRLVALFAEALVACEPGLSAGRRLLKPVTMSLFGMLNWHYMWFRPEGPMSREDYADLATRIILAGARDLSAKGRLAAE